MFKRTVSFLRQLVGGQAQLMAADTATAPQERRVRVRYPSNVATSLVAANGAGPVRLSARVRNISRNGVNLQVNHRFEPGELLSVELPGADGGPPHTALACVVHATPQPDGDWALGCTFSRELSDDDLRAFGARRQRTPTPHDNRTWVRFPCNVKVMCQTVTAAALEAAWPAQVLNISANGIGLLVDREIEPGTLLSVELQAAGGQTARTILACVVHVTEQGVGHQALGCNFIRELSEKELLALL
jgi:hypothetical protein